MKPCFLGIPDGRGKGYTFTFPFPYKRTTCAAKGVMFMDITRKPFLFGDFYILLIKANFSLRSSYFEP